MRKLALVIVSLVALSAIAQPPPDSDFPPFTVGSNQTARINAVMGAEPHLVPPGPCRGTIRLRFYNGQGNVVAERTARIEPGINESLEFVPPPDSDRIGRMVVRAQISWVEVPPGPCRATLFSAVESYSTLSGDTQFVIAGAAQPAGN